MLGKTSHSILRRLEYPSLHHTALFWLNGLKGGRIWCRVKMQGMCGRRTYVLFERKDWDYVYRRAREQQGEYLGILVREYPARTRSTESSLAFVPYSTPRHPIPSEGTALAYGPSC